jgi:TolB-like protein/cytochrome c-type biogenesis protein CcmH/NrfG
MERRLAAILAADVVGYSRLMETDEAGTLAALKARRKEILQPLVAKHHGRVVKLMGDGVLVEFASAVSAVQCGVELQEGMAAADDGSPENLRITLRIGINLGDVMVEGGDLYGDGVNIAARLEGLAEPGSVYVSQTVFSHVRGKVKLAFKDLGEQSLKNMAEPVRVYKVSGTATPAVQPMPADAAQQTKPSIAVLPFVNMSGDPEQEYFSDGITEDIISALSRVSALWVIARTSTFTYKGKPTDVKQVARELGVRYVMEGSVRRAGDRLRVTAQLIDAATGHHLWAERYDRSIADLFDIQDEITRSVAASTETQVYMAELDAEREAAKSRPSADFKARDLIARANEWRWSPETFAESYDLVEQAIRIDPSNPVAHRLRANLLLNRIYSGELPRDDANVARALEFARTALRLAPGDEYAHWVMAGAYAEAGRLEDAVAECETGLEINPNCAVILQRLGACLAPLGRTQEAIKACRLAIQLDPRNPANFWRHSHIAVAHFVAADYEAALQESRKVARSRQHLQSAIIWAASAAALGKADEARTAVEDCLRQRPDLRISKVPGIVARFARDEDHDRLVAFLLKAGLPE